MNVILINPPMTIAERGYENKEQVGIIPPMGLCYIAAAARENGISVEIIDALLLNLSLNGIRRIIEDRNPKVIGVTASSMTIGRAEEIINYTKKINPYITTILGGPHFSALPKETMVLIKNLDFGVMGEGEETFVELIKEINKKKPVYKKIKGLVYREKSKIIVNPVRILTRYIDSLPMPARDLLPDLKRYRPGYKFKRLPAATMISSRGCPFQCVYCDKSVFGDTFRGHSAKRVVDEIEELVNKYGIKEITFLDDNFILNKRRVMEICDLLDKKGIDITWSCLGRVDQIDEELLKRMKSVGCWGISFGIESGDTRVLKIIRKDIDLDKVRRAVSLTKKAGMEAKGYFMIGLPGDTKESINNTINFAKSLLLDSAEFAITVPYPGSKLYTYAEDYGSFERGQFKKYASLFPKDPVFIAEGLSKEYLLETQKRAYKEFYLRPAYIIRKALSVRSFQEFKNYSSGFINWVKKLLFKQ